MAGERLERALGGSIGGDTIESGICRSSSAPRLAGMGRIENLAGLPKPRPLVDRDRGGCSGM